MHSLGGTHSHFGYPSLKTFPTFSSQILPPKSPSPLSPPYIINPPFFAYHLLYKAYIDLFLAHQNGTKSIAPGIHAPFSLLQDMIEWNVQHGPTEPHLLPSFYGAALCLYTEPFVALRLILGCHFCSILVRGRTDDDEQALRRWFGGLWSPSPRHLLRELCMK